LALRDAGHPERALQLARLGGMSEAETLPVGVRDAALLRLWCRWFGATVPCLDTCPACDRDVSFDLPVARITGREALAPAGGWRCLTTQDLVSVARLAPGDARRALATAVTAVNDPDETLEAEVERWLERHDPLARIDIELACAFCSEQWSRPFDIVEHLWSALRRAGQTLLRDIHVLASAYHWSEADILALPPARRRAYIAMVSE
jgi:hypothetical protein